MIVSTFLSQQLRIKYITKSHVLFCYWYVNAISRPIVGSYSYDPITQLFEPKHSTNETLPIQIYNSSYILSTAVGGDIVEDNNGTTKHITYNKSNIFFRKHVTSTIKTTHWWARSKATHKNLTRFWCFNQIKFWLWLFEK